MLCVEESRIDKIKSMLRLEYMYVKENQSIMRSIESNQDRFHVPGDPLEETNVLKHRIKLTSDTSINVKQYRLPPSHKEEVDRQIKEYLESDIIRPSISLYLNPAFVVPKKADSEGRTRWRMVLDFRKLNEITVGNSYPLPLINEILDQLGNAKYFTTLDLFTGFHQVFLMDEDAHKPAFNTPGGYLKFKRFPSGLSNAHRTFQRVMDIVLSGLTGIVCFVFLDDIVIYDRSLEEH